MWLFFLALPGTILGLNIFLAWAVWRLFAGRKVLRAVATGLVLLALAFFALSFFGFARRADEWGIFAFAWEFLAFGVVPMIYLSFWAIAGTLAVKIFPKLSRFRYVFAGTGVALVAAVCAVGFWKFEHPQTRRFVWAPAENRFEEVPAGTEKPPGALRVVATADWHLGSRIGRSRTENFVRLVNAQNPDAVVVAGDLLDGDVGLAFAAGLDEILQKISAPLGVFVSLGNHEYFGDLRRGKKFIRSAGLRLLQDEGTILGGNADASAAAPAAKIFLVGRDDATNASRAPLAKLLAARPAGVPAFVIDHQPRDSEEAVAAGADFVFCGHTHAGQLWPATWLVGLFNPHVYGPWREGATRGYVTSGLGLWHVPYRIGCASELVVIDVF